MAMACAERLCLGGQAPAPSASRPSSAEHWYLGGRARHAHPGRWHWDAVPSVRQRHISTGAPSHASSQVVTRRLPSAVLALPGMSPATSHARTGLEARPADCCGCRRLPKNKSGAPAAARAIGKGSARQQTRRQACPVCACVCVFVFVFVFVCVCVCVCVSVYPSTCLASLSVSCVLCLCPCEPL